MRSFFDGLTVNKYDLARHKCEFAKTGNRSCNSNVCCLFQLISPDSF